MTRAIQIEFLLDGIKNPTSGEAVASGTAYFYEAGTTTPKNVWTEKEKTNAYSSYSLNGIGAAAADMVGLDLELFFNRDPAGEGARWRRFHTGYADFRLEEQRKLFSLLDPGRIGIRLNPACIMIPEKSVSGIMALKWARA